MKRDDLDYDGGEFKESDSNFRIKKMLIKRGGLA